MSMEIELIINELSQQGCSVAMQWIPSHCDIAGNDYVDKAAKDGALLPFVTNDVHYSISEVSAKLRCIIHRDWNDQYTKLATDRHWIVQDTKQDGLSPDLPRHLLPIFYRLRGKTYLSQYTPQNCTCGSQMSYDHIFQCQQLIPNMPQVSHLSFQHNIPLSPRSLLNPHPVIGWSLVKAFVGDLRRSDIGHLV